MAPLDVASLPHLQSQLSVPPKSSWNETDNHEDEESWEVRAFADDTASAMGTIWPPRSYTCTFCRREFRSAQALGGHMNVHRRDRARLHQTRNNPANSNNPNLSAINRPSSSMTSGGGSTILIPSQEFLVNGGLCLLYQLHNNSHSPPSISPYTTSSSNSSTPSSFIATYPFSQATHRSYNNRSQPSPLVNQNCCRTTTNSDEVDVKDYKMEELDLELRLGHGPPPSRK